MAFGIAAGANGNPNTKEWSQAERIQVTAQALYGYGYWGPFLLEFEEKSLSCGQEDLVRWMSALVLCQFLKIKNQFILPCSIMSNCESKIDFISILLTDFFGPDSRIDSAKKSKIG